MITPFEWLQNIDAFIGVGTALLALFSFIIVKIRIKWMNNIIKHIEGEWYQYNLTIKNKQKELVTYHWRFKNNWLGNYISVKGYNIDNKKIEYIGKVINKERTFFLTCKGKHKGEDVFFVIDPPYPIEGISEMYGIGTGLNYDKEIMATRIYFSRNGLDEKSKNLLKNKLELMVYKK